MLIGSVIYNYPRDYLFQSSGWYSKWVPEDHSPIWYLRKVVRENQGNLVALWDGGATAQALKAMAFWMDLKGLGLKVPEPDWERRRYLKPEDWDEIARHPSRYGAGIAHFVTEAEKLGLASFVVYGRSRPKWLRRARAISPRFLGLNIGESFSLDLEQELHKRGHALRSARPSHPGAADLETYRCRFQSAVRRLVHARRREGWPRIFVTTGSFALDYEIAAGATPIPFIEDYAFHHMNVTSAYSRGLARQWGTNFWGSFLAHEHYAYLPYASRYRFDLLRAGMYLKYISGSKLLMLESGNWWQQTVHVDDTPMHVVPKPDFEDIHDVDPRKAAPFVAEARRHYPMIGHDSAICRRYRRELADFYRFVRRRGTPDGQPETRIAVAKGRLDGASQEYNPNLPVWGAWRLAERNPRWFEGPPERGWDIMKSVFFPRRNVLGPYRNKWLSGTPYGMVDIVSFNGPVTGRFLSKNYRALVFLGWNTATPRQYAEVRNFVRAGGTLFISIPHLSTNTHRDYRGYTTRDLLRGGDFRDLCGVRVLGRGKPFYWATILRDGNPLGLPRNKRYGIFCTHWGRVETAPGVEVVAYDNETNAPVLLHHRCGKGEVWFLNSWAYPGALVEDTGPGATFASKGLIGEVLKAIGRKCRGRAWITDDGESVGDECEHVAFSFFPRGRRAYLLNVDADRAHAVWLHREGRRARRIRLRPLEFRQA